MIVPLKAQRMNERRVKVLALQASGMDMRAIATATGIPLRSVHRLAAPLVPQRRRRTRGGVSISQQLREELPRRYANGNPQGGLRAIAAEFDCPVSLVSAIRGELGLVGRLDAPLRKFARLDRGDAR